MTAIVAVASMTLTASLVVAKVASVVHKQASDTREVRKTARWG